MIGWESSPPLISMRAPTMTAPEGSRTVPQMVSACKSTGLVRQSRSNASFGSKENSCAMQPSARAGMMSTRTGKTFILFWNSVWQSTWASAVSIHCVVAKINLIHVKYVNIGSITEFWIGMRCYKDIVRGLCMSTFAAIV
jgi:hypothetical protein